MRVLIVVGVAGGASCAACLRRLDEKAETLMVERGPEGKTGVDSYTGFQVVTKPKRAVVVGGGFIGLEMVENFAHLGLENG